MTYTQVSSDEIVLQLSNADFDRLMFLVNMGVMRMRMLDWAPERLLNALEFINHLNSGSPHYIPYETGALSRLSEESLGSSPR